MAVVWGPGVTLKPVPAGDVALVLPSGLFVGFELKTAADLVASIVGPKTKLAAYEPGRCRLDSQLCRMIAHYDRTVLLVRGELYWGSKSNTIMGRQVSWDAVFNKLLKWQERGVIVQHTSNGSLAHTVRRIASIAAYWRRVA